MAAFVNLTWSVAFEVAPIAITSLSFASLIPEHLISASALSAAFLIFKTPSLALILTRLLSTPPIETCCLASYFTASFSTGVLLLPYTPKAGINPLVPTGWKLELISTSQPLSVYVPIVILPSASVRVVVVPTGGVTPEFIGSANKVD